MKAVQPSDLSGNKKNAKPINESRNNEMLHKAICEHLRIDDIYYYQGVRFFKYHVTDENISISDNKTGVSQFKALMIQVLGITKDLFNNYMKWLTGTRFLAVKWKPEFYSHLFEENFTLRPDIKNSGLSVNSNPDDLYECWLREKSYRIDRFAGVLQCYTPAKPLIENNNDDMLELLEIILGTETDVFLNYLSFLILENRTELARPTLMLTGVRGAGKNLLVETIISNMLNQHLIGPLPPNYMQFTGFYEKKFVFLDEQELDVDRVILGQMVKKFSGSKNVSINKKRDQSYKAVNKIFFAVMANARPFNIREMPDSPEDNQFLLVHFTRQLNADERFKEFREKHGSELSHFVKKSAGYFIKDVLIPRYRQLKQEYQNNCRYGFPIPITKKLEDWNKMSSYNYELELDDMIADLYQLDIEDLLANFSTPKHDTYRACIIKLRQDNFISNTLLRDYAIARRISFSLAKINNYVREQEYIIASDVQSVRGRSNRGFQIDKELFDKYVREHVRTAQSEFEQQELDAGIGTTNEEYKSDDMELKTTGDYSTDEDDNLPF